MSADPPQALPQRKRMRDHDLIRECLYPSMTTPYFVKYGMKMDESPLEPHLLVPHKMLLERLRTGGSLSLNQSDVEKVLEAVHNEKKSAGDPSWSLNDAAVGEWKEEIAKMVRTMCRHYSQGLLKSGNAPWVKLIRGASSDIAVPPSAVSSGDGSPPSRTAKGKEKTYLYGWDHEAT